MLGFIILGEAMESLISVTAHLLSRGSIMTCIAQSTV